MKSAVKFLAITLIVGIFAWSCSDDAVNTKSENIEDAIVQGAEQLATAMDEVKTTNGYELVMLEDGNAKSAEVEEDEPMVDIELTLAEISGVYVYNPIEVEMWDGHHFVRFFERIEDYSQLLVKLPAERMLVHRRLHDAPTGDTTWVNNFEINVSDYLLKVSQAEGMSYKLASQFTLDGQSAGALIVNASGSFETGRTFSSVFTFGNGYVAKVSNSDGEQIETTHTFMKDSSILFEENVVREKMNMGMGMMDRLIDKTYTLTIGNIMIKRTGSIETIEVYIDGVLQENAVIEIVDNDDTDPEASVCRKRDIKITVNDGSTFLLSELTKNVLPEVGEMFAAMRRAYFSTQIIDWIARDVMHSKNSNE